MKQETYQDQEPVYQNKDAQPAYMHDWVFHYNHSNHTWAAIPRDKYNEYWNDYDLPEVIRSSSIHTLLDLLHRTKGDKEQIQKLVKYDE